MTFPAEIPVTGTVGDGLGGTLANGTVTSQIGSPSAPHTGVVTSYTPATGAY